MTSPRDALANAKRLVVKVGSQLIADSPAGRPAAIADDVSALVKEGREVVLVSSGAIALGLKQLKLAKRPTDIPTLQAAAAIGQTDLMRHWEHGLAAHKMRIAQVLITHDDIASRARFLRARNALRALLAHHIVPIVNENDTVAVEEIKYGDNDPLAALICNLVSADALCILTNVDGLCDKPPSEGGKRISIVRDIEKDALPFARKSEKSSLGSGGMSSKIHAANAAAQHGVATCVLNGSTWGALARAAKGEDVGTLFVPSEKALGSRKHWLAFGPKPTGWIKVDEGAHRALVHGGKSLLPAGILEAEGQFGMGDIVGLRDQSGTEFARGLTSYSAEDLGKVMGKQSADIEAALGYKYVEEVIHRDDLAVKKTQD